MILGVDRVKATTVVLLLLSLVLSASNAAGMLPLPLEEYWRRMEETRSLVVGQAGQSSEVAQIRLRAAAEEWAGVTAVRLPDETVMPVEHSFLVAQLRAEPPNLERLRGLLDALLSARQEWPQARHDAAALLALQDVLSRPEFQWPEEEPSALAEWLRQVQEWFADLWERLFPEGVSVDAPVVRYLLLGLGVALLGSILAYVLRNLRAGVVAEAETGDGETEENLTAAAALKQARAWAERGDRRTAVRYLYLSALLLLEERGLLRYDRSLTNREYLRSVAGLPELQAALQPVIEVFERVWYGYQPPEEAEYGRFAEQVAALQRRRWEARAGKDAFEVTG